MSVHPRLPDPPTDASDVLRWMSETRERPVLASSLGPQSIVVLHLLEQLGARVRVVLLDTGLLFPETLRQIDAVERRFGVTVERVLPERTVEEQARDEGPALWARDPDRCCALRKVEPLGRALRGHDAWIAGLRRDQSPSRAEVSTISWDTRYGLVKVAPLAHWSAERVREHLRAHDLPQNELLTRGYPSIGCVPCTRPSTDERGGRWADLDKTECGIHLPLAGVSA